MPTATLEATAAGEAPAPAGVDSRYSCQGSKPES